MLAQPLTLGAGLAPGRESGARKRAAGGLALPTPGCPRWCGPCTPAWTLSTDLTPSQVKIYGAGRSRILQALVRRPETLTYQGPEKEEKQLPALQPLGGTQGPRSLPYLRPQRCPLSPPGMRPSAPLTRYQGSLFHRVQEPRRTTKSKWGEAGP